jgi:hypothetical protein
MVTGLGSSLAEQILDTDTTEDDQTEFGFFVADGMPTRDHHTSITGSLCRPPQEILLERHVQVGWKGCNIQGKERLTAHCIYIGKAVGSSNRTIIIGIIDHRREEISGQDQGIFPVKLPDCGIIRGVQANQKLRMIIRLKNRFEWSQNLLQRFRAQLGCSASTGCQAGQPDLATARTLCHDLQYPISCIFKNGGN